MMASIMDSAPVEFFLIVGLLVFVVAMAAAWSSEREKRLRLLDATKELEEIQHLTAEALQEHSDEKVQRVNEKIGAWDQAYTEDVGGPVAKLETKQAV